MGAPSRSSGRWAASSFVALGRATASLGRSAIYSTGGVGVRIDQSVSVFIDPVTVFLWSACLRLRCRAARGPLPHWDRTRGSSAALPRNRGRDYRTPSPRTSAQLLLWMFLYAAAHLGVRNKTVSFMGTPTLRALRRGRLPRSRLSLLEARSTAASPVASAPASGREGGRDFWLLTWRLGRIGLRLKDHWGIGNAFRKLL